MASIDSIPLLSQVKSLVQVAKGDVRGARRTQSRFTKQCLVVSQVRSAVEAVSGDMEAARKTQDEFTKTAPVISQIRSAVELAKGDTEAAKETKTAYFENLLEGSLKKSRRRKREREERPKTKSGAAADGSTATVGTDEEVKAADDEFFGDVMDTLDSLLSGDLTEDELDEKIDSAKIGDSADADDFDSGAILSGATVLAAATVTKGDDGAEESGAGEALEVPFEFICPIGYCLMSDPVICSDGQTYDREHIEAWFEQNDTSPNTGCRLDDFRLIPNIALRSLIQDWTRKHGDDW